MALTFENVSVALGGRRVLEGVDAAIRPGRLTAVLGPNGAGKSALVRAAAGLVAAQGRVLVDGDEVGALEPRERARRIGYLPQDAAVHWNMTVAEVVALGRLPHRDRHAASSPADAEATLRSMAATDTAALAGRRVGELSGGERARVLLARVLAGEPRWLLADEPLASLDPAHQIDLIERLRDRAREGCGVVVVLHDLAQAARAADDVMLLYAGRLVGFGSPSEVLTAERIAAVFSVRVAVIEADGRSLPTPIGLVSGGR